MKTSAFQKNNLKLDGNILTVFKASGFWDGKMWKIDSGNGIFVKSDPIPIKHEIEKIISNDIVNGQADFIDHIKVKPEIAIRLYLEGVITKPMIMDADVQIDNITFPYITFQTFEGEKYFNIMADSRLRTKSYCTFDADGNMI